MREIVLHDKLGEVMKDGVDPAGAAREMDRKAKAVGMKVTHFYNLQELYYLSDSMSYQEIRQYFYFEWFENRKDYGRVQHLYRGRPSQRLERLRDAVAGYEPKPVAPPPPQTQEPEAEDATRDDTGGSNQNQAGQTQAQPQVQTQGNGQSGQTQGAPTQGAVSQGGIGAPSNTTPQPPPGLGAQQAPPKRIQLLRNAQIYQVSRGPGGEDQFHKVYIESDSQIYKINKIVTSDHGDYFEIIRFQNYYQVHKSQVKVID
jgi:hypothetical protein